jgi:hypothetical protein
MILAENLYIQIYPEHHNAEAPHILKLCTLSALNASSTFVIIQIHFSP